MGHVVSLIGRDTGWKPMLRCSFVSPTDPALEERCLQRQGAASSSPISEKSQKWLFALLCGLECQGCDSTDTKWFL